MRSRRPDDCEEDLLVTELLLHVYIVITGRIIYKTYLDFTRLKCLAQKVEGKRLEETDVSADVCVDLERDV